MVCCSCIRHKTNSLRNPFYNAKHMEELQIENCTGIMESHTHESVPVHSKVKEYRNTETTEKRTIHSVIRKEEECSGDGR